MPGAPFARPHRCRKRARHHRQRARMCGYLLPEVLCALAVLGLGLLPPASAAVVGLQWLREQAALNQAMRVVAEAAEQRPLGSSASPLAPASRPASSRLVRPPVLCATVAADATAGRCLPGSRLALAALAVDSATAGGATSRGLRAIALWLRP